MTFSILSPLQRSFATSIATLTILPPTLVSASSPLKSNSSFYNLYFVIITHIYRSFIVDFKSFPSYKSMAIFVPAFAKSEPGIEVTMSPTLKEI